MAVTKGSLSKSRLSCPPKNPTLHGPGSACLEFQIYICKIEEEIREEEKEKETFVKEIGTIHLFVLTEIQCHELSWIHGGGGGW